MRRAGAHSGRGFAGRTLACSAALILGTALCLSLASAGTSSVASVGPLHIDSETFTRRASRLAPFQWASFGATWPERRRRFLDELLIPEALLEVEAGRLPRRLVSARDTALSEALLALLRADVTRSPVSAEEVAGYRALHQRHYETPRSLLLWRILVRTEAEARALIQQLAEPKDAEWSQLARERSLDVATHMRAGSLGYVAASGQSHFPEVRVAPALFAAADHVPDGALVPEPVIENDGFAVVWRRASRAAEVPPLSDITPEIQARILEQRHAAAYTDLIERLRREHLTLHQPELLAGFAPEHTEPPTRTNEGPLVPAPTRPVRLLPQPTDRGLR
jgi:hypothetical protein